jgi:hypothetical protein
VRKFEERTAFSEKKAAKKLSLVWARGGGTNEAPIKKILFFKKEPLPRSAS